MMAEVELNDSSVAKESTAATTMMSRIGRAALFGTKGFFPLGPARFSEILIHYFGDWKSRFQINKRSDKVVLTKEATSRAARPDVASTRLPRPQPSLAPSAPPSRGGSPGAAMRRRISL